MSAPVDTPRHGHPTAANLTALAAAFIVAAAVVLFAPAAPSPTEGTTLVNPASCDTIPTTTTTVPATSAPTTATTTTVATGSGGGDAAPSPSPSVPPPPPTPTTAPSPPTTAPVPRSPIPSADDILEDIIETTIPEAAGGGE